MTVVFRWRHTPEPGRKRGNIPTPRVVSDNLDEVWNPVDGKRYTSKGKYYDAVKASGCEIVGNDSSIKNAKPKPIKNPGGLKNDLRKAWDQAN